MDDRLTERMGSTGFDFAVKMGIGKTESVFPVSANIIVGERG